MNLTQILMDLGSGFLANLNLATLFIIMLGAVVGMLSGALPGVTLVTGVILALPFTYGMEPVNAIILLAAIYISGTYGGALPAILFKIPGEPIHVPMLWDGFPMARRGEGARALGWALVASISGGLFALALMVLVSAPLAQVALKFSSPEFFAIVFLGLTSVLFLGSSSIRHSLVSLSIGLLVATVGVDEMFGTDRFTFNTAFLRSGIDYLNVLIGVYAISEIFTRMEQAFSSETITGENSKSKTALPSLREFGSKIGTYLRSSVLGTFIGFVPGAGATIASFISYGIEKQIGKNRHKLGKGSPDGLLASQSAATASVGGAMIPLLAMGIPGSGATAIILGAFLLHGIQPGPGIFMTSGPLVYAIFASMFLTLIAMILLGYLSVKPLMSVLQAPEAVTSAFILVLCMIGAYAISQSTVDVWILLIFGVIGYFMDKYGYPSTPLVLGTILGPIAENAFLTSMISFHNDWLIFFKRPASLVFMLAAIACLFLPLLMAKANNDQSIDSDDISVEQ